MSAKKDLCVTFDLWETLLIDQPELDDARNRMRYEGLHKALSGSGVQITLKDLKKGYEQSAFQLQAIWRGNRELSTIEQIRTIMSAAGLGDFSADSQLARNLEKAYVATPSLLFLPSLMAMRSPRCGTCVAVSGGLGSSATQGEAPA